MQIDADRVSSVLLPDGWHRVKGRSFVVEPYTFGSNGSSTAVPGATWMKSKGRFVSCPLSSILAVRHAAQRDDDVGLEG
jgi:hypothetical protein